MPLDTTKAATANPLAAFLADAAQTPRLGHAQLVLAVKQAMDDAEGQGRRADIAELTERLWREAPEDIAAIQHRLRGQPC